MRTFGTFNSMQANQAKDFVISPLLLSNTLDNAHLLPSRIVQYIVSKGVSLMRIFPSEALCSIRSAIAVKPASPLPLMNRSNIGLWVVLGDMDAHLVYRLVAGRAYPAQIILAHPDVSFFHCTSSDFLRQITFSA